MVGDPHNLDCCAGLICNPSDNVCEPPPTCTTNGDCLDGGFCDTGNGSCCAGLGNGATLAADGVTGNDFTPCCGIAGNAPCRTLTKAMVLIDAAQAPNVTIRATVNDGGGDWTPTAEKYPIVLGWGVELSAPGVFFADLDLDGGGRSAILEVDYYSGNDSVGYASIVGTALNPIGVGMNAANTLQTSDVSTLAVESGNTLYLANASVNNSALNINQYTDNDDAIGAILVLAGATLWLGQDQSAAVYGTVQIGNALGQEQTDGYAGIVCTTDYDLGTGCTIRDAELVGQSSVVIEGQFVWDILATDFADISLASAPVFGTPPVDGGFSSLCRTLDGDADGSSLVLWGLVRMSIANATVQCAFERAFTLIDSVAGSPALAIDNTLFIYNSGAGIDAQAGTATVMNSTFRHNLVGAVQEASGTIDLGGGGNVIVCSTNVGILNALPGVGVWNLSSTNLNASNVAWDTPGPDFFTCNRTLTTCSCNLASCTLDAGSDGMDAVEDSTLLGGVPTAGNTLADAGC